MFQDRAPVSRSMGALCRRTASRAAAPDKMDPLRRDDRTKRSTQEEPDMDTERFDTVLTLSGTRRHALRSLAGLARASALAGILGADDGAARKMGKS